MESGCSQSDGRAHKMALFWGQGQTYRHPTLKTRMTPAFLFLSNCRFQTAFVGISKIIVSVMTLTTPLVLSMVGVLRHVPGMDLSQILALGTHSQILTKKVAT